MLPRKVCCRAIAQIGKGAVLASQPPDDIAGLARDVVQSVTVPAGNEVVTSGILLHAVDMEPVPAKVEAVAFVSWRVPVALGRGDVLASIPVKDDLPGGNIDFLEK